MKQQNHVISCLRRFAAIVGAMSMLYVFTSLPSTWSWYTGKITVPGASFTIGQMTALTMSRTVSHTYTPYPEVEAPAEAADEDTVDEAAETEAETAAETEAETEAAETEAAADETSAEEPVAEVTESLVQNAQAPGESAEQTEQSEPDGEPEPEQTEPDGEAEPETVTELYTQVCIAVSGTADRGYVIVTVDDMQYLISETVPGDVIYFTAFGVVEVDAQAYPGVYDPGESELPASEPEGIESDALAPEAAEPLHNIEEEFEYMMTDGVAPMPELSECFADYTVEHPELALPETPEDFEPEYPEPVFNDPPLPETSEAEQTPDAVTEEEEQSAQEEQSADAESPAQPEDTVQPESSGEEQEAPAEG